MSTKKEYPRLEERKGVFYIYDYVEAKLCRQSIKTNSRLNAENCLEEYINQKQQKELEIQKSNRNNTTNLNNQNDIIDTPQNGVFLFDEIALMFLQEKERQCKTKTIKQYKFLIKTLLPFFSEKNLNSIKRIDLKQFEDLEKLNGVSDGLLVKKLSVLQTIFNYALELELINNNPFNNYNFKRKFKSYGIREKFFTPIECQLLTKSIRLLKNNELERLIIFILETGLRIKESLNIQYIDIAFQNNISILHIRKEIAKSNRDRFIPLSKLAQEQILKQKTYFPNSAFIFTTKDGLPYKTEPKTALNNALKKAGLKSIYVSFHTLRHTAGSLWLQGVNINGTQRPPVRIEVVSEILGHRDISFTKNVYAKLDNNSIAVGFLSQEFLKIN